MDPTVSHVSTPSYATSTPRPAASSNTPLEALESALQKRAEALIATTKEMRRALV